MWIVYIKFSQWFLKYFMLRSKTSDYTSRNGFGPICIPAPLEIWNFFMDYNLNNILFNVNKNLNSFTIKFDSFTDKFGLPHQDDCKGNWLVSYRAQGDWIQSLTDYSKRVYLILMVFSFLHRRCHILTRCVKKLLTSPVIM